MGICCSRSIRQSRALKYEPTIGIDDIDEATIEEYVDIINSFDRRKNLT
jgi:hypothetical protein